PFEVLIEETKVLESLRLGARHGWRVGRKKRARVVAGAVAPRADDDDLRVAEGEVPLERARGRGRVEPTGPAVDRYVRALDLLPVMKDADVVNRPAHLRRSVVAEGGLLARLVDVDVSSVLGARGVEEVMVAVAVDRA